MLTVYMHTFNSAAATTGINVVNCTLGNKAVMKQSFTTAEDILKHM